MIRRILLTSSLIGGALMANAKEAYIIKDGKYAKGWEKVKSKDDSVKFTMEEMTLDGTNYVEYKTLQPKTYGGLFLYNADGIDLNDYWEYEVTYFFPEGSTLSTSNLKLENFRFEFAGDTVDCKYDYNDYENRLAHSGIDTYFRNFYENDTVTTTAILTNHGVGKEISVRQFIFRNHAFKDRNGNSNIMKMFGISFAPESTDSLEAVYIKDIKLIGERNRPFFMDNFKTIGSNLPTSDFAGQLDAYNMYGGELTDFENESVLGFGKGYATAGTSTGESVRFATQFAAGQTGTKANIHVKQRRLWQSNGEQCKTDGTGYFDVEESNMIFFDQQSKVKDFSYYLRIPIDGAVKEGEIMNVAFWMGHCGASKQPEYSLYEYTGTPLKYYFDNGTIDKLGTKTEAKSLLPEDNDSLKINITKYSIDVVVPEGGQKFFTIEFIPQLNASYMFGHLILTAAETQFATKKYEKDVCGNLALAGYTTKDAGVETVSANALTIYPNPASSEIVVVADVEKVEVVNALGQVVATSATNNVNIASLANGLYIVKAYTNGGVLTGTVVKK